MNNMSNEQLNLLQLDVDLNLTDMLPDGAFNISEANNRTLKFNVQSNDKVYAQYHKNDGVTKYGVVINNTYMVQLRVIEGQIYSEDLIAKAYFRKLFPKSWWFAATQFMPKTLGVDRYIERILDRFGCLLYPICLAVLLPMFMYTIVLEKEEKLLSVMRMNGMRMKYYWISNFIFDMILYFLAVGVFLIFAIALLDISVFKNTDPFTQFMTFLGWGYSQISLAFFFSVFTSKAQNATIMGYVISIWTTILAVALNSTLFEYPNKMPSALHIYPTFSFARLEYLMSFSCGFLTCMSSLSQMMHEAKICLIMIFVMSTVYLLIGLYLNEVLPQQYGVPSHPLFPLHYIKSLFCGKKTLKNDTAIFNNVALNKQFVNIDLSGEDNDVKQLNNVVKSLNTSDPAYNLIIKDIKKIYQGDSIVKNKLALKQFNLAIERGELFGLLGPNGAGKTSLISMLTGLYPPTYGNAWIASNSLKDSMDKVYLNIGICPQFDTLWGDLTIKEHLEFYGRLKGQSSKILDLAVEEQIKKVKLNGFQHLKVRQLSGGMKRRLSVAISLVGSPRVVFLDEPTTGIIITRP
jgi:ABC-type Na+ transport system ATPase subunit NatA